MKRFFLLIIILNFLIIPLYSAITSVSKEDVPADTFYPNDINKLVYKINLTGTGTDVLNSIKFTNQGTAQQPADISELKLWYQASGGDFNPGTATFICTIPGTGSTSWEKTDINFIVAAGSSLYVSVNISSMPTNNRTIKMTLLKNGLSIGSSTYPNTNQTNANTQTISNPPKLLVSYTDYLPVKVNQGQQNIYAVKYTFQNTATTGVSLTGIILRTINYSGEINANTAISRIVAISSGTTYADINSIPASPQITLTLSPQITITAGSSIILDIYIYLLPEINTKDIGIRLASASDISTQQVITKEAYPGYSFPMDTKLAIITRPASSVNVSHTNIMPVYATDQQQDIKSLILTFTHPQSITTYADCSIRGITLVAQSLTNPLLKDTDLFSRIKIYDSGTTYADIVPASGTNQIYVPFSTYLNISAASFKSVTISADLKSGLYDNNFYVYVSNSAATGSFDGTSGTTIIANGSFPMASSLCMVQRLPSSLGINHINKMPSVITTNQQFVYAEDFVITHPNTGNYPAIEVKGITLNVEDNLGNTIVPSSVISKLTILDSGNNTIISYSSIPSSGYKIYLDFPSPILLLTGTSKTLKVYIDVPLTPSGNYVKLNLNSSLNVNAVDGNSHVIPVTVLADSGDVFPMKTSAAQILNAATDVKVRHVNTMPASSNAGQQNITSMRLNFLNDSGGVVSIENIKFYFSDNLNNPVSADSVVSRIKIDNVANTMQVYVDSSVTTNNASLDLNLTSPVLINYGSANSVTVNVKINIADPALNNIFKMSILAGASITAKDSSTGNTITVIANNDSFPMHSSHLNIETRANTLNVSHDPANSGSAFKGDANVHVMDFIFENPVGAVGSDILITGITLTVENSSGNTISPATAISRIKIENKQTSFVYGEISTITNNPYMYFDFPSPITIPAGTGNNITCSVKLNISSFATASNLRINLYSASYVRAIDENQLLYVTVSAKTPDTFPMRSDVINIISVNKMTVLHINTMPETASNGQQGVKPFIIRFANASDAPVSIHSVTLTVENISDTGIIPDSVINKIYVIDSSGNTNIVSTSIPSSGSTIYLEFSQDVTLTASSYKDISVFVDLKDNTYVANFQLNLASATHINAMPVTLTVEPDPSDAFPMRSGNALIQIKPVYGGIAHTDVMPTTVSTGQTNIFAEILHLANYNIPGSADIQLTGITITVEDDTNSIINPVTALKKIMIRDENNIYAFYSGIPSTVAPFYVPFIQPVSLSVSQTTDVKLYVDIVDTISTGNFQINIKIDADVTYRDKNSGLTITAHAINGDSFPMRTSVVIIQEKATLCKVSYQDLMPVAVNRGQQNITVMKLSFINEGSANGANVLITRIILNTENSLNLSLIPKTAISRLYIKDSAGTIYGDVSTIPDYGDSVSIALTTPITVQVSEKKDVYVVCNINSDAVAGDFKISLRSPSGIIARDANSYDLINVSADSGYAFPMKTSAAFIQNISQSFIIYHQGIITPTVNKGDTDIPSIYCKFINPNPAGYSDIVVKGITITVEDNTGTGIVPSSVISRLKIQGISLYGVSSDIPLSGEIVYIPLTITPLIIPPSSYIGVTLYADISITADQLYLQFDLRQGDDCYAIDKNSETKISTINAETGDSFPMRSGFTTIYNPPGIEVLHTDLAPVEISENQKNIPVMMMRFSNTGSFNELINGITLTVKDEYDNIMDPIIATNNIIVTDGYGNTYNTLVIYYSDRIYLDMSSEPVNVFPLSYEERYIYIDSSSATFSAQFYISVDSNSSIISGAPVSSDPSDPFPMNTKLITLKKQSLAVQMSFVDMMPPSVSTEQKDVFVFALNLENVSPAGYSPVVLNSITFTVKDALSNTISANSAITRVKLTDLSTDYVNTTNILSSGYIYCDFAIPLTITAGENKTIYCTVDITGNTLNKANNFKLSFDNWNNLNAIDYYSGNFVTVSAKPGYVYPFESSAALIQKKAMLLTVHHEDIIPLSVSTNQENVKTMNIIFTNPGDLQTSSIMITRMNFYLQDESNQSINPKNVISELAITSRDGFTIYGVNNSLESIKITVNLTAPVIVSSSAPVTLTVKVKTASLYTINKFKINLESENDIYAIDANSFERIQVSNRLPDTFPMKSGITTIENGLQSVNALEFTDMLPSGVTKGEKRVGLFAFKIENNSNSLTASAILSQLRIKIKDSSNNDISSNSVIDKVYLVDVNGATITSGGSSFLNYIDLTPVTQFLIPPASYVYVSLYADILNTATGSNFKVLIDTADCLLIYDENKGSDGGQVFINYTPSLPWQTNSCGVYNAPATDLIVWHDGSSFIPDQVGRGQKNVKFMSLSLFNPAGPGTSDVLVRGVTITVFDNTGTTLAPSNVLDFLEFTDLTGTYFYGGITASALTMQSPFYMEFNSLMSVPISNTITVYFKGKISSSADLVSFNLSMNTSDYINCHNNPSGYITVTAKSPDSFPMTTDFTSVITSTNIVKISHENLMPVSIVKGQQNINGLKIIFKNQNNLDIAITGITITVKNKDGNLLDADNVLNRVSIKNAAGDIIYASQVPGSGSKIYIDLSAASPQILASAFSQTEFVVSFDVSLNAAVPFMLELENPEDIITDQPATIQADTGEYFGNMKSTVVSIQEPQLTQETYHNFPNPFNPDIEQTHIEYYLSTPAKVTIKIFNLEGRPVRTIIENGVKVSGLHYEDTWDGLNDNGKKVKSGIYVCVLEIDGVKYIKKIAVLR